MIAKRGRSIRGNLTGIIMLTSATAVLLACLGFVISDLVSLRNRLAGDLTTLASVIGSNSTAALAFGDRQAAHEVLGALRAKPSIIAAVIYSEGGQPFARYAPSASISLPRVLPPDGLYARGDRLELVYGIRLDQERIGTLYIASDRRNRNARLKEYAVISAGIVLVSLLIAFVLSSWLQRSISVPIVELARVASLVSLHKNFSMRASSRGSSDSDEIGNLMTGFNGMLAEIEQRDDRLLLHQSRLEETVALRTGELTAANENLLVAKNIAERVAEINAQLARESALILNSATDGIMGIDLDNRPTFLNPAGARILGMTLSDFEEKSVHEAVHHSHADGTPWPEADCAHTQAMRRGQLVSIVDTLWRPDGTSIPVEYSSTPMIDEAGKQLGAVMMFRDVTERQAVERLKSEFVSTVSHELRTPLTSIRGALGLLGSGLLGPIAEKGQRMLAIAVSNTDRLVRLINDILDLERIESGKVELVRGSVDAHSVMVQALEGVQSMADQAGVRLISEPATGALWGDSDRIIQTLTNLLGNAIKFSPPDTTVTLSGTLREADFVFCIADHGRGVPREKLATIFERFSQVNASDSRDKGGSGLGLAICRSIVDAHGGRIWVEGNDPVGSRFQFTIPLAVPTTQSVSGQPQGARTVLVCHQDPTNVVEVLERHGFRVMTAATCPDLIARAGEIRPDAILLDLADGADGLQMTSALEASPEAYGIPVIIVAGQFSGVSPSDANTMANWVRTPWESDDLLSAVNRACQAPSVLVVEDDLDLARVMTTALQNHGIRTLHAARGGDAIELCRQHQPSLIVLDLVLPDMDGYAVVKALRNSAILGRIPLLVYSAEEVGNADQSRLRLGPTEFLTKSRCSLAEFQVHVVRLLETVTSRVQEGQHAA